jgi:copper homeostasis protein
VSVLEVAVTGPAGAAAARRGGADRVELCCALELGGLTPGSGLTEAVLEAGLPVNVLIRPRAGDFVYSGDEIDVMEREITRFVRMGVSGVVIGALRPDATVDQVVVGRLAVAAGDVQVIFHRAVDHCADPVAAVELLAAAGVKRVLSSGGAARAVDGVRTLAAMRRSVPELQLTAGGGVRAQDVSMLLTAGIEGVHLSAKRAVERRRSGPWVSLGTSLDAAHSDLHWETDAAIVTAVRAALNES